MLQQNFAKKIETNQTLKKKENMENIHNFQTTTKMTEGIKTGVEVMAQKVVNKVENVTQFQVAQLSVPKQRLMNKTVEIINDQWK